MDEYFEVALMRNLGSPLVQDTINQKSKKSALSNNVASALV